MLQLQRYRQIARRRLPWWLFGALLVWWLASLIADYREGPPAGDQEAAAFRVSHTAWTVATALEDQSAWVQWLLLGSSAENAKQKCFDTFDQLNQTSQLSATGARALAAMRSVLENDTDLTGPPSLIPWRPDHKESEAWAWEVEALTQHFSEGAPAWAVEIINDHHSTIPQTVQLWISGFAIWVAAFIVGLPFVPAAIACFKPSNHQPPSPITRCWQPQWILGLILVVLNFGSLVFIILYLMPPLLPLGPLAETVVYDGIWRFLDPLLLGMGALVSWKHGKKLLKLATPPSLKPLLGMLPLVIVYDILLGGIFALFGHHDLSGLVYPEEDGIDGLIYAVISAVVFAPIAEEIVYRGFLFQSLEKRSNFWQATLLSTLIFVLIHYYGFEGSLSVASFGIIACALYRATGSLWTPIAYHALINGLITASYWPLYNGLFSDW